eukprot:6576554-Heterocapsa_arctica.AAC.1
MPRGHTGINSRARAQCPIWGSSRRARRIEVPDSSNPSLIGWRVLLRSRASVHSIQGDVRTRRRRSLKRLSPAHKGRRNASSPRLVRTAGNIVTTGILCPSVPI